MNSIKVYYKIFIWSLVIAYLCFAPSDDFKKVNISIPHFDKVVHFGMFFILGIFITVIKHIKSSRFNSLWLPVLAIIYGGAIELIQLQYIYKRNGDLVDWLADIIGLFIGIWIFSFIPNRLRKLLA